MPVEQRGNQFVTNRPIFAPKHIPRGVERRIVVLTVEGHPELTIACGNLRDTPRPEFVDEIVRRVFGLQESGEPHLWETVEEAKTEAVTIQVTDNPVVQAFLEEKINGAEVL